MKDINSMSMSDLISDETFAELFEMTDVIEKTRLTVALRDRARKLGSAKDFNDMLTAYKGFFESTGKHEGSYSGDVVGWTNFTSCDYPNMKCGDWLADETGVYMEQWIGKIPTRVLACYHPILPVLRLRNMESGEERIKLVYKRRGVWEDITVEKEMIASANKIVTLSNYGISVTSENAKQLVKYLSDVENLNDSDIPVDISSSKLGWHDHQIFLPYDKGIIFDGDKEFRDLYGSVKENGSYDIWLEHVKYLRNTNRLEIKLAIAASFASIIVEVVDGLPFVVDFWNKSGGGKTVLLMLAASVWADPAEGMYIGNFDQSVVGQEVKGDLLNSLPMLLDDTSNAPRWTKDDFERFVYMVCAGKGKSRSNKKLGLQRERRWKNCTITNGESPISDYATKGGAINRVIECLCTKNIFDNPRETLEIIRNNFGFAGKIFVDEVKKAGKNTLLETYNQFSKVLFDADKTAKQIAAASVILTADKLATEKIFKDDKYLSVSEVKELLVSQSDMSDDVRCYQFLMDKVARNPVRFEEDSNVEQWGIKHHFKDKDFILFNPTALEELCDAGKYSLKSFLSWAKDNGILYAGRDKMVKQKKINGKNIWFYWISTGDKDGDLMDFEGADLDENDIPF